LVNETLWAGPDFLFSASYLGKTYLLEVWQTETTMVHTVNKSAPVPGDGEPVSMSLLKSESYWPASDYWDTCNMTPLSDTGRKRLQEVTCVCWEFISLVTRQNMCVPKVLCNHFISCSIYIYWIHSASAHYCRSQAFKMNKQSLFPFRRRRGINTWSTRYST